MVPPRRLLWARLAKQNSSRPAIRQQWRRNTTTSASEAPAPPKRRVSLRPYIYATAFIALGVTAGNLVRFSLVPVEYPPPFTTTDDALLARLTKEIDALDVVQKLRAASLNQNADGAHKDKPTETNSSQDSPKSGWREVLVDSVADVEADVNTSSTSIAAANDSTLPALTGPVTRTLTKVSCAGYRGFGVQRVFWNEATRELVAVIWFGGAVSGWPGVTHGGAIATMFTETLSRALIGPDRPLDSLPNPSSLALTYVSPTQASHFYVIRANVSSPESVGKSAVPEAGNPPPSSWFTWFSSRKDLTKQPQGPSGVPTVEISGTLERLDGRVCVKAKATWPASER